VIASLSHLADEGKCDLLFFDESGFSPNPSVGYGWTRVGQSRCVEPQSHRHRVNVLGALRQNGELEWTTLQHSTARTDVVDFFEKLANQPHDVPRIVVLDNAALHKGDVMEEKRRHWERKGLYWYYLPPYCPELNRIEIVWKQAKYFWRRFVSLNGDALLEEVQSLMKGFGTAFTINFA
jgi:transposase